LQQQQVVQPQYVQPQQQQAYFPQQQVVQQQQYVPQQVQGQILAQQQQPIGAPQDQAAQTAYFLATRRSGYVGGSTFSSLDADDEHSAPVSAPAVPAVHTAAPVQSNSIEKLSTSGPTTTTDSNSGRSIALGLSIGFAAALFLSVIAYFGRNFYLNRREKIELEAARKAAQGQLPLPYAQPLRV